MEELGNRTFDPRDFLTVRKSVYWLDLVLTALIAYSGFLVASLDHYSLGVRVVAFIATVFAFYRSIYFNHEIFHNADKLRYFEVAYNILIGYWTKFPSYFYEAHRYHHQKNTYGTPSDPEWADLKGNFVGIVIVPLLISCIVPIALIVRFFFLVILLPFSTRDFRQFVFMRLSTFAILPSYSRPLPTHEELRRSAIQDSLCFLYFIGFFVLLVTQTLPILSLWIWGSTASLVFLLNHFRAMTAHTYHSGSGGTDYDGQIASSMTVEGTFTTFLWAPMNIGYHALHHMYPKIPYHNLKIAHGKLIGSISDSHPYRKFIHKSFWAAFMEVLK